MRFSIIKFVSNSLILCLFLVFAQKLLVVFPVIAQLSTLQNRSSEAEKFLKLGIEYHRNEQREEALKNYQQALEIYREIHDRKGEASALHLIAAIYNTLANYGEAIQSYQQALQLYRNLQDRKGEASVLNSLGRVYQQQGKYSNALGLYQQAITKTRQIGDHPGEADTLNNIGSLYYSQGQYAQALNYYQQSLRSFERLNDGQRLGSTLNNIGLVYSALGQHSEALKFYQRSLQIQKSIGNLQGLGTTLHNSGFTYAQMGQTIKAIGFYQQALAVRKFVGDKSGEAKTLNNLGFSYEKLGRTSQALKSLEQALAIFRAIQDQVGEGHALDSIGTLYRNLGEYTKAFKFYQQSLVISQAIANPASERITLSNIGKLLETQKQPELAIVFYKQAINVTEKIRQPLKVLPRDLQESYTATVAETYRSLADLLLRQDRILEAQQVLDLLKVQELDDYLRNVRGNQQTAQGIEVLSPEAEILRKYSILQESAVKLGQELAQLREVPETKRTAQQQQRIAQLVQLETELNQQFNRFLDSSDVEILVEQLSRTARRQNVNLEDLNALRSTLRKYRAVLLYPLILDDRLELILTTADSPPLRRTVNVNREDLNKAVLEFHQLLQDPKNPKQAQEVAQTLYTWLIKPLEAELKQANVQTIIYAPDGQLRYIPLAALYDGDRWLVQRYQVNNITARSLTDFSTPPESQKRLLAGAFVQGTYEFQVGDRQFLFNGLPFAGKEVDGLAATIPDTTKLIDKAFGREAVLAKLNEYSIIHFATHAAFLTGQPEDSFILFGNGDRATLREVENWSLQNVDLVVLSACETGLGGLGNGEEILGLGYQFQRAGARAAIASLWAVNDNSTQVLMTAFYQALKTPGVTKAAALRQAQLALIGGEGTTSAASRGGIEIEVVTNGDSSRPTNTPFAHPYYWAPFILIGNGL